MAKPKRLDLSHLNLQDEGLIKKRSTSSYAVKSCIASSTTADFNEIAKKTEEVESILSFKREKKVNAKRVLKKDDSFEEKRVLRKR